MTARVNHNDAIGSKFGQLTVLDVLTGSTFVIYRCKCDCGTISYPRATNVRSGSTKTCGRHKHEPLGPRKTTYDKVGKYFGRLLVLSLAGQTRQPGGSTRSHFWCICDPTVGGCGTKKMIFDTNLKNAQSCGCLHRVQGGASMTSLLRKYKTGAIARGVPWQLTVERFAELTSRSCSYCGIKPSQLHVNKTGAKPYIYSGIDRVNNELGYLPSNCVPCCKVCNHAKATMTKDIFIEWAIRLAAFQQHKILIEPEKLEDGIYPS